MLLQDVYNQFLQTGTNINTEDDNGDTALLWACCHGHTDIVVQLLLNHKEIDLNHTNKDGHTALMGASINGHLDIVMELLNHVHHPVDVNQLDNVGHTALSWASLKGNYDIVLELLKHAKVNVSPQDYDALAAGIWANDRCHADIERCLEQHTLNQHFIGAAKDGKLQEVYSLVQEGANINAIENEDNHTALTYASLNGHSAIVATLLTYDKVDVNHQTKRMESALLLASANGHVDMVAALLKHDKIDVNVENIHGDTALLEATSNRHYDIVFQLLNLDKINLNHRNKQSDTALSLAVDKGHTEIAWCLEEYAHDVSRCEEKDSQRFNATEQIPMQPTETLDASLIRAAEDGELENIIDLLEQGANINATDISGNTALILASHKGHRDIVVQLLKHDKVDTNLKNNFDCTALMMASNQGNVDIVCALLKNHEVDVNFQNNDGQTALSLATCHGHTSIVVKLLQDNKIDVNLQDNHGTTALMMASVKGLGHIVVELLKHDKINVNCHDKDGDTALLEASSNGYLEIVCELLKHSQKHSQLDVNHQNKAGKSALLLAVDKGQLDIVVQLLKLDNMNVNLQDDDGNTALTTASLRGSFDIVRELLKHDKVDANHQNKYGETALTLAIDKDHEEIVWCLEEYAHLVSLREEKESLQFSTKEGISMQEARELLRSVMERPSSDPVELPIEYIQNCTTQTKLGTGAFGEVYLGRDTELAQPFVVKTISITHSEQADIDEIRTSFQREISKSIFQALKRFRHPNLLVLYGYSLNVDRAQQYLVYEHTANGSLDGFLRDDGKRSRLTADIRLSIMFELARAVHFLHTGGCDGYRLFHRDIKSANICLAEDYTARLIDCGLAKLVPIDSNTSAISSIICSTGLPNFGTPGYMCPEYATNRINRRRYAYKPACDVYSVGVVMAELISGSLVVVPSSSGDDAGDFDLLRDCVEDKEGNPVANGWERLKEHADPSILWTPMSLDVVCKAAISCMKQTTEGRMTTTDLLPKLSEAIHLNRATKFHICDKAPGETALCGVCFLNMSSMTCSEGHVVCTSCIENKILRGLVGLAGGRQIVCPFDGCSSLPFRDDYLYGRVSIEVYTLYIQQKTRETEYGALLSEIKNISDQCYDIGKGVNRSNKLLEDQVKRIDKLAQGLDRNTALLSLLAAEHLKKCPHLVWITPVAVSSFEPKEWVKSVTKQKYKIIFICAHSYQPAHEPFEVELPRDWIVKVAPWLELCLKILILSAHCMGLPFPIPNLERTVQFNLMAACLNSVARQGTIVCDTILEQDMIQIENFRQVQELASDAFECIAEIANAENRSKIWRSKMIPVYDTKRGVIWVKHEHENDYKISTDV